MKYLLCLPLTFSLCLFISCNTNQYTEADIIITNGTIWTGEGGDDANTMAIKDDEVVAIGEVNILQTHSGPNTKVIDLYDKFITPGFIDSHVHLLAGGRSLLSVELRDANTKEEFIKRISDYANTLEPGAWIVEGNWDHTLWGGDLPEKGWIDEYTQNNPMVIFRLDGHMVLANSAALVLAGIDKNTPNPDGGVIVKNAQGEPTGILKSNASILALDVIPDMSEEDKEKAFRAAMVYFASQGVTSVHDVDSLSSYNIANRLSTNNELTTRIYNIHPLYRWDEIASIPERNDNKWTKRGGLKGFVDGSLGSHTAAFHQNYTDNKDDKGILLYQEEELYNWIVQADKHDLQVMVHAIGDKAIHTILNIYEKVIAENGVKNRRLRIEHAQHIAPEDITRFGELGVIASVQPYHAIDDGRWAEEVIGAERIKTTYAFKSLLDANTKLAFGSDWAVAPASPLLGIYAVVTRRTLDDKNPNGWIPEQKISVEEAMLGYTKNAAYASFEDDIKGTLAVGKLADFVVIDKDLRSIAPEEIRNAKILETYIGGKKIYGE